MKLGACTACLHDKPLPEAQAILRSLGPESSEINSGGFIAEPHLPIADLQASERARQDYLGIFAAAGITPHRAELQRQPAQPRSGGPRQALRRHPAVDRDHRLARGRAGRHHVRGTCRQPDRHTRCRPGT